MTDKTKYAAMDQDVIDGSLLRWKRVQPGHYRADDFDVHCEHYLGKPKCWMVKFAGANLPHNGYRTLREAQERAQSECRLMITIQPKRG